MRPHLFLALGMLVVSAAGCLQGNETDATPPAPEPPRHAAAATDEALEVAVTVPVALIGFPNATTVGLEAELEGLTVEHESLSFPRGFVADEGPFHTDSIGIVPTARHEVHHFDGAFRDAYFDHLEANLVEGEYSANAAEDWLAEHLAAAGFPLDDNVPALVLVHKGDTGHTYRVDLTNGWVEGVRAFGERHPLLVFDVSTDDGTFWKGRADYDDTLDADDVEALADLVEDATRFRLLQGPIYPVTTTECHAITLIVAVRGTAVTELHPDFAKAEDVLDVEQLRGAWQNVTGTDEVYVDPVFLLLPVDDPALEGISRMAAKGAPYGLSSLRWWLDENWDQYWVPHEGCEAYASFLLYGDWADAGLFGVAMYQVEQGHRISFSLVGEDARFVDEYDGPGSGDVVARRPASREDPDWVDFLFAHETGHLLGQRHPHDITEPDDGDFTFSFSSVWTSMSYQHADRLVDFGKVDAANHARNQAGAAYLQAKDTISDEQLETVVAALEKAHWDHATQILLGTGAAPATEAGHRH